MKWLLLAGLNVAFVVVVFVSVQAQEAVRAGAEECRATWVELATGATGHEGWTTRGLAIAVARSGNRLDKWRNWGTECRPLRAWARRDWAEVATFTVLQGADAWGTERGYNFGARWQEANPLVPRSSGARAGYFAATYAGALAASWALDRAGHRKLARGLLWVAGGMEAQAAARTWHSVLTH